MKATVFCCVLCIAGLAAEPPKLTDAIREDIRLMRERGAFPAGIGATGRALAAAQRVFTALPLEGMTRRDVFAVLGEPSKFGAPSPSSPGGHLVYWFQQGFGGVAFVLTLDTNSRVTKVSRQDFD